MTYRIVVIAWLALVSPSVHAKSSELVEALLSGPKLSWADHPATSPDGKRIAFVLKRRPEQPMISERILPNGMPSSSTGSDLTILDLEKGQTRSVCPKRLSCVRPSWSPDGKRLAFYSDEGGNLGLWQYDVKTSRRTQLAFGNIKVSLFPGDEPKWSPDGKTIYFLERPKEVQVDVAMNALKKLAVTDTVRVFRAGPAFGNETSSAKRFENLFRREHLGSIVAVDRETLRTRTVVASTATPPPTVARLSTSGRWLSYLAVPKHEKVDAPSTMDLVVVSSAGGTPTVVATGLEMSELDYFGLMYRWHPVSDELFFCKKGSLSRVSFTETAALVRPFHPELKTAMADPIQFDASGKFLIVGAGPRSMSLPFPSPSEMAMVPLDDKGEIRRMALGENEEYRGVLASTEKTAWQDGEVAFAVVAIDTQTQEQVVVGLDSKKSARKELWRHHGRFASLWRGTQIDGKFVSSFQDGKTAPDLYAFDKTFRNPARLSTIDRHLSSIDLTPAHFVSTKVKLFDGSKRVVNSAVLLPPGAEAGKPSPAIVIGYPGSDDSVMGNYFAGGDPTASVPSAAFLARGYAVVILDLPIGPEGKPGEPVKETVDVLLPQIDRLVEEKLIDENRLAVMGQSYGGYFASSVLTRTKRFKAGIAISGIFDLPSHYGQLDEDGFSAGQTWAEGGQGRMGAPLWMDIDRYLRNSPYFQADKIETPLLLIHGTKDTAYEEAKKMYMALRQLNRTAELVVYPNEAHVPSAWTLEHGKDAVERMLAFLDRFLR